MTDLTRPDEQTTEDLVVYTGSEVSGTLPDPIAKQSADDRSKAINTVLTAWKAEAKANRELRDDYAWALFKFLVAQYIVMGIAFFGIGTGYLQVDQWVASTFIGGIALESSAMVFFIVKYLFSRDDRRVFDLIEKL